MMASRSEATRTGAFLVTEELGAISRDTGYLAEGEDLAAGTLLAENDDGDLVAWESGDCAGILFAGTDATVARVRVTTIARLATVNFELLSYGEAEEADARDALLALRIVVISDHAIVSDGGGGGGDYTLHMVHFDGATWVKLPAMTSEDSGVLSYSFWSEVENLPSLPVVWVVDPEDSYFSYFEFVTRDGEPSDEAYSHAEYTGDDIDNPGEGTKTLSVEYDDENEPPTRSHHLVTVKTDSESGTHKAVMYHNGVKVTATLNGNDLDAHKINVNGLPLFIGGDMFGTDLIGSIGNFWFAPGVNLLDEGDNIPEVTLRKFITAEGLPVDPVNFPDGEVLLTGNAAAFPTNQGTGGGTLTVLGNGLTDA